MSDQSVAALLDSDEPLVVVEAPAGCGKTYQGAKYAARVSQQLGNGRALILTHTHAACSVFAAETKSAGLKVEIRTIDSLIAAIAGAYHKSLDLPPDPAAWARAQGADGFEAVAARAATLLNSKPMIAEALANRYPVIICDEHQDSTADQHQVAVALNSAGARMRVFGDPMQNIYGGHSHAARAADKKRWDDLKSAGAFDRLTTPHRWAEGTPALGAWILEARAILEGGGQIDLTGPMPQGLEVHYAENIAAGASGYRLRTDHRRPLDLLVNAGASLFVLTGQKRMVDALYPFWGRRIPIWEGYTRDALADLVVEVTNKSGDAPAIAQAVSAFLLSIATGFTEKGHAKILLREVESKCATSTRGMPARFQEVAKYILEAPDHIGAARALSHIAKLKADGVGGFGGIQFNHPGALKDAIRLGDFEDANDGMKQIHHRRSFARPVPQSRAISTIHKAKGLECENAIVIPCDQQRFGATDYARCKLYVALSRAKRSLHLVVSRDKPSPLFRLP